MRFGELHGKQMNKLTEESPTSRSEFASGVNSE